jgi:hypothetical protein
MTVDSATTPRVELTLTRAPNSPVQSSSSTPGLNNQVKARLARALDHARTVGADDLSSGNGKLGDVLGNQAVDVHSTTPTAAVARNLQDVGADWRG